MSERLALSVFFRHDPQGGHTWSGVNQGLCAGLKARGAVVTAVDVEVHGWPRVMATVREFSLSGTARRENLRRSPRLFRLRSRLVSQCLRGAHAPDAVVQVGAMFDAASDNRGILRYCYLGSHLRHAEQYGGEAGRARGRSDYRQMAFARERRIYRGAAGVFTDSEFVRDALICEFGVRPERVHAVGFGTRLTGRTETPASQKEPVILFAAREFAAGGGPLLLQAFSRVRAAIPHARLIVAGCGFRASDPGVESTGIIDTSAPDVETRMATLYTRAAVFTVPRYTPFCGIPCAEAAHFGVPSVTANQGALPEIVSHGSTGLLVSEGNVDALAQALVTLLRDPARSRDMGMTARVKARRLFTWDAVAARICTVIARERESGCDRLAV